MERKHCTKRTFPTQSINNHFLYGSPTKFTDVITKIEKKFTSSKFLFWRPLKYIKRENKRRFRNIQQKVLQNREIRKHGIVTEMIIPLPSTYSTLKKTKGKKNSPHTFSFLKFNFLNQVRCCIILKPTKELQNMYLVIN